VQLLASSRRYFAKTMRDDLEKWGKLVRDIGFTPR
jgi:hypothetical protein